MRNKCYIENEEIIKDEVVTHYPELFHEHGELNIEDIALMQHYGIPTRLLDVTFNSFIAMYFATENVERTEKIDRTWEIAVFKIPKEYVKYSNTVDCGEQKKIPYHIRTTYNNPRIKQQNGAFLNFSSNVEKIPDDWIVTKIEISNSVKKFIRTELAVMNISQKTIFLELEHFKTEIERKYWSK